MQSGKYVQFERLTWLTKMSLLTRLTLTGVAGTAAVGAVLAPAVATQVKV